MNRVWKTGDEVTLKCDGRTVPATVRLASSSGRSLMLEFEAILDGHVAMMPVLWDEARELFASVMTGIVVEIAE